MADERMLIGMNFANGIKKMVECLQSE